MSLWDEYPTIAETARWRLAVHPNGPVLIDRDTDMMGAVMHRVEECAEESPEMAGALAAWAVSALFAKAYPNQRDLSPNPLT